MGIRLTGVSTPVGGFSWEYTGSSNGLPISDNTSLGYKIKVFISSICGDSGKYDKMRSELRKKIEETQLAIVYTFEGEESSTLTAKEHYTWALEESDICIFLIDNKDGVRSGVQNEIDTAQKYKIKSIYYFCDENSTEKTALEKSLMGANYAKSKTIHKFEDLCIKGAEALINDIVNVYHYYCKGKLVNRSMEVLEDINRVNIEDYEKIQNSIMPKMALKNLDKCKEYILKITVGFSSAKIMKEKVKTSELDVWGVEFIQVLFENKPIRQFNVGMYLNLLEEKQNDDFHSVVQLRWDAIQKFFSGNVEKCIESLDKALSIARNNNQPMWLIQDILIDLRNQKSVLDTMNNTFSESEAQKQLNECEEQLFYPVIDRINVSLEEKYIEGLYKKKIESPYTISLGNNFEQYGDLLASLLVVAMYNGSLTHILMLYKKIRVFLFYLTCKYEDWNLRRDLLKMAIYSGKDKEVDRILNSYPEILNNLQAQDAKDIMVFCKNNPIKHRRFIVELRAFGCVGYYLSDFEFEKYKVYIISEIEKWIYSQKPIVIIGQSIFKCLGGVAFRLEQDELAELCCSFLEKKYMRWYTDMFKFMEKYLDLNKMSQEVANRLLEYIVGTIADEKGREQISNAPFFLANFKKQNEDYTLKLDMEIESYMPDFYNNSYKLETTKDKQNVYSEFVKKNVYQIKSNNEKQGKNGTFFGHGECEIETLRAIILDEGFVCEEGMINELIPVLIDTISASKEDINTKVDAVSLLNCVLEKNPKLLKANYEELKVLCENRDSIIVEDNIFFSSNIDKVSLKIGLCLLAFTIGLDVYYDFMEALSQIQNDTATTIKVLTIIKKYYEIDKDISLPEKVEIILLQNVLQWLRNDNLDVRWNTTFILLALGKKFDNNEIIEQKLLELVNYDCVYIKNLILSQIIKNNVVAETTREYIISKCEEDPSFVVRKVCKEISSNCFFNG
ncbi:hypothetical protein [Anaerosacchariphilus polymeriproducens]|uniref:DUF4062 domain-containing protein n=1 Tax=Anaerosacchariphilus polymeriproducens TaxID=1812858 RepID=A0A371AX73_9FIRM|nr:hypothetical protein [Anaerosacchariphilus polymeriproducens]RDU24173.1 hypothetical protein DWV06_05590 [Anaerosacchariphilus polymeriproducens]